MPLEWRSRQRAMMEGDRGRAPPGRWRPEAERAPPYRGDVRHRVGPGRPPRGGSTAELTVTAWKSADRGAPSALPACASRSLTSLARASSRQGPLHHLLSGRYVRRVPAGCPRDLLLLISPDLDRLGLAHQSISISFRSSAAVCRAAPRRRAFAVRSRTTPAHLLDSALGRPLTPALPSHSRVPRRYGELTFSTASDTRGREGPWPPWRRCRPSPRRRPSRASRRTRRSRSS